MKKGWGAERLSVSLPTQYRFIMLVCLFLILAHHALDVEACELCYTIGAHSDGLFEVTRECASAVVCHLYLALLAWLDRSLCV